MKYSAKILNLNKLKVFNKLKGITKKETRNKTSRIFSKYYECRILYRVVLLIFNYFNERFQSVYKIKQGELKCALASKYKDYIHKIYILRKIFCAIIPVWKSFCHHCPPPLHPLSPAPPHPFSSSFSLTNEYLFYILVISSQLSPITHVNPPAYTAPSTSCLFHMFYGNKISPISTKHTHMSVDFILCGTCNRPTNKPPPQADV